MIAKLYGRVEALLSDRVLICVQGIVFDVLCSARTLANLALGQDVTLWIEHLFRAETQILCGFLSYDEQLCFREVTSVQGVGAKVALALLSLFPPQGVAQAILEQDKQALLAADGVGSKMAERLLMELKNSKWAKACADAFPLMSSKIHSPAEKDAVEALVSLGYDRFHAKNMIGELVQAAPQDSAEKLIKAALANQGRTG
ncbi:Holliday junction ATP-dependent DNA helicase RuvA [Alphaproteobacteria bacterium]|nr:Holliday junction ATP-dependent DNA helicase RuvA [Alphaproteobacteria bacterium]GHS98810.1 Holliday junction ATP-dependent DNA helicase RuvA [Alphaproteobacteria bacterium]